MSSDPTMNRNKNRKILQAKVDEYYGGKEKRIAELGYTCLDCVRDFCLATCKDKNKIALSKREIK